MKKKIVDFLMEHQTAWFMSWFIIGFVIGTIRFLRNR